MPPDQLAWGWQPLQATPTGLDGSKEKQDLLIVAVKKEGLEEYAAILSKCGGTPVFTLAALVRSYVCPQPPGAYAVLAVEHSYSELITMDGGVPVAVRILPWGRVNVANPWPKNPGNTQAEAAGLSGPTSQEAALAGSGTDAIDHACAEALAPLVRLMSAQSIGRKVYLTGIGELHPDFTTRLENSLANGVECQTVGFVPGQGGSAAILGLQKSVDHETGWPPLILQIKETNGKARVVRQAPLKWIAAAAGLVLLALILPYAEAILLKSHVAKKLAAIKTDQGRLATIDRELDFLQYLQQNEPPYLDALVLLAKAAPAGTHFDAVSMNRRGDVSLRGSLRDGQQVAELRSKMIDSGFFANVGIEEQTPTPDRQKVNVRMSAQWKPTGSRVTPSLEQSRTLAEPKSPASQMTSGAPPPGGVPAPTPKPPTPKKAKE